jgi:hypothetical protein
MLTASAVQFIASVDRFKKQVNKLEKLKMSTNHVDEKNGNIEADSTANTPVVTENQATAVSSEPATATVNTTQTNEFNREYTFEELAAMPEDKRSIMTLSLLQALMIEVRELRQQQLSKKSSGGGKKASSSSSSAEPTKPTVTERQFFIDVVATDPQLLDKIVDRETFDTMVKAEKKAKSKASEKDWTIFAAKKYYKEFNERSKKFKKNLKQQYDKYYNVKKEAEEINEESVDITTIMEDFTADD